MRRMDRFSRGDEESDINLTPMLDVVFIMLIFFIVTATFIKQTGIDPLRPEALTYVKKPTVSVLVGISAAGDVWIDGDKVPVASARAYIERIHSENPAGGLVVQADQAARTEVLVDVLEAARLAGITDVAVSTAP